jgi:hypothetical protein
MGIVDAGIKPIVFALFSIADYLDEGLHIGIFFEVPKELKFKKADRVIGKSDGFIPMGDNRSDKGEINQGGDESREPSDDAPIGMDLDVPPVVGVFR